MITQCVGVCQHNDLGNDISLLFQCRIVASRTIVQQQILMPGKFRCACIIHKGKSKIIDAKTATALPQSLFNITSFPSARFFHISDSIYLDLIVYDVILFNKAFLTFLLYVIHSCDSINILRLCLEAIRDCRDIGHNRDVLKDKKL